MDRGASFFVPSAGHCFWPASYLAKSGRFSPAQLTGLTLWYDAQNAASLTGDPVAEWADVGPGGRTLTQGSASNQPDLATGVAAFAGRHCVDFHVGDTAEQGWMQRAGDTVTAETSGTVWAVVAFNAEMERVVLSVSQNSPTQRYWQVYAYPLAGELRWAVTYRNGGLGTEAGVYTSGAAGVLSPAEAYLLTASSDGSAYRLWINGMEFAGGALGAIGALGNTGSWVGDVVSRDRLAMGARIVSGSPVTVADSSLQVAEIVMTAPEASGGAIQQMHAYLSERYGIALAS